MIPSVCLGWTKHIFPAGGVGVLFVYFPHRQCFKIQMFTLSFHCLMILKFAFLLDFPVTYTDAFKIESASSSLTVTSRVTPIGFVNSCYK